MPERSNSLNSTRRAFLRTASLAGSGAVALSVSASEATAQARRMSYALLTERLGQRIEWVDTDLRLLRRITLGLTDAEVMHINAIGFTAYLEEQLNATSLSDDVCDTRMALYPELSMTRDELRAIPSETYYGSYDVLIKRALVERAVLSRRQLKERMTEFWADHFNIANRPDRLLDFREVVQQHALGNFRDMVAASMRSCAMLSYLDQVWSNKWGVNENYARELLELHTCSPAMGYSQADVHAFARALTGWTIDEQWRFQFRADWHDFGQKTVLGLTFPAQPEGTGTEGMHEAMQIIDMVLSHPTTARFLATKLLRWFIRPDPTEKQITSEAMAYLASRGDIKAMLRAVLTPENLTSAPAKLKRPFHLQVSALRASGVRIDPFRAVPGWESVHGSISGLGHGMFEWQTPDGYPDRPEFWASNMVPRWNAMSQLVMNNQNVAGQNPVWNASAWVTDGTPSGIVAEINRKIFGGEMTRALRDQLTGSIQRATGSVASKVQNAVYHALCSPGFQFY